MQEIIQVHNRQKADVRLQDGGLPHAKGTHCIQIARASKNPATATDGNGWTYNHAAMICYWNGEYWVDYLTDPVSEHVPPSKTMLTWSADGYRWAKPVELFPPLSVPARYYTGPCKEALREEYVGCVMHQRMSFYVTKDKRLLATGFYGIAPEHTVAPNNGYGVGRVVREIYPDHSFSPMYFLRINTEAGFDETAAPQILLYTKAADAGFVKGCRELLDNRLVTAQMWEEERLHKEAFTQPGAEAFCYFTLPDETVTAVYKKSLVTSSRDKGEHWEPLQTVYSLETSTGKVWGERTADGRYALCYNPTTDSAHRWPIAVTTGENGRDFYDLYAITPEVSPHKYAGLYKNLGPQYIRGIVEANPRPADGRLHLVYTVNKEDVWTSATALPVTAFETEEIHEDFSAYSDGSLPPDWNLYIPAWSPVRMEDRDGHMALTLYDADPFDRCRAMRIMPEYRSFRTVLRVALCIRSEKTAYTIDFEDAGGRNPIRLVFNHKKELIVKNGGRYDHFTDYRPDEEIELEIEASCIRNQFSICFRQGAKTQKQNFAFSNSVCTVQRILFASKTSLPFNTLEDCGKWGDLGNLPDADVKLTESRMQILRVDIDDGEQNG